MKLWRNNKLDQEWEMTVENIAQRFLKSKHNKDIQRLEISIPFFIGSKEEDEGLASTMELEDYGKVIDYLFGKHKNELNYYEG